MGKGPLVRDTLMICIMNMASVAAIAGIAGRRVWGWSPENMW